MPQGGLVFISSLPLQRSHRIHSSYLFHRSPISHFHLSYPWRNKGRAAFHATPLSKLTAADARSEAGKSDPSFAEKVVEPRNQRRYSWIRWPNLIETALLAVSAGIGAVCANLAKRPAWAILAACVAVFQILIRWIRDEGKKILILEAGLGRMNDVVGRLEQGGKKRQKEILEGITALNSRMTLIGEMVNARETVEQVRVQLNSQIDIEKLRVSELEAEKSALEAHVKDAETELESVRRKCENMQSKARSAVERERAARKELDAVSRQLEQMAESRALVDKLQGDIRNLRTILEERKNEIKELRAHLQDATRRLDESETARKALRARLTHQPGSAEKPFWAFPQKQVPRLRESYPRLYKQPSLHRRSQSPSWPESPLLNESRNQASGDEADRKIKSGANHYEDSSNPYIFSRDEFAREAPHRRDSTSDNGVRVDEISRLPKPNPATHEDTSNHAAATEKSVALISSQQGAMASEADQAATPTDGGQAASVVDSSTNHKDRLSPTRDNSSGDSVRENLTENRKRHGSPSDDHVDAEGATLAGQDRPQEAPERLGYVASDGVVSRTDENGSDIPVAKSQARPQSVRTETRTRSEISRFAEETSLIASAKELVAQARSTRSDKAQQNALFDSATAKLLKALEISSRSAAALFEYGAALLARAKENLDSSEAPGTLEEATNSFRDALALKPEDEAILFNYGLALCLLAALKEPMEAENLYKRACIQYEHLLKLNEDCRIGIFNCGLAYLSRARLAELGKNQKVAAGFYQRAKSCFQRSLEIQPGDAKSQKYILQCSNAAGLLAD